jgi:hypothetical protein
MEVGYPKTIELINLLKDIDEGKIRLPDFQRDFRWEVNNISELLVSMMNGYPVGVLLFWNVKNIEKNKRLKSRLFEGVDESKYRGEEEFLVLDGQQRLTSLYQLFFKEFVTIKGGRKYKFFINLEKIQEGKIDESIEAYNIRSLRKNKLEQTEEQIKSHLIPTDVIFDENKLREWKWKYVSYHSAIKGNEFDQNKFLEHLSEFDQKFLDRDKPIYNLKFFKFHIIEIPSTDLEVVATIFEKLNTTGEPLNIFEILTAKFYNKVSLYEYNNLREIWEETKGKYPLIKKFSKDKKDTTLAVLILKSILLKKSLEEPGKESLECKRKNMLNDLSHEDIDKYWDWCSKSLNRALNRLQENFGCPSREYLPYTTILVPFSLLIDYIDNKVEEEKKNNAYRKLEKWYWASVFSERYDSATDTKSKTDLNDVISWINDDKKIPSPVKNFDINSLELESVTRGARFIGILNIIIRNNAKDFITREKIKELIIAGDKDVDVHHLFPGRMFEKDTQEIKDLAESILNKTLIKTETNRNYIKADPPSVYIEKIKKHNPEIHNDLKEHFIPLDEFLKNNFDEFIKKRKEIIIEEIKRLIGVES